MSVRDIGKKEIKERKSKKNDIHIITVKVPMQVYERVESEAHSLGLSVTAFTISCFNQYFNSKDAITLLPELLKELKDTEKKKKNRKTTEKDKKGN